MVKISRALCVHVEDTFSYLEAALENLGFKDDNAKEFKIFCDVLTSTQVFKYPKNNYKGIPIVVIPEFPRYLAFLVCSNDFPSDPDLV